MNINALIQDCLAQLPRVPTSQQAKRKLVLAYSGGVDSEVLAYGLAQFSNSRSGFECLLVHVHHGLSANADSWASHCRTQGTNYALECKIKQVSVKRAPRLSIEAEARQVRYQALLEELNEDDVLITAHHQDDQLETVLLALKRGLGPKGLAAMGKVQRLQQKYWLIRPLLDYSKEQVEAYAAKHNLIHIEDESNFDDKYDRNFLRLAIIPKLKQRWSAIATTASRSAELCALQQSVLDEEVAAKLPLIKQKFANDWVLKLDVLAQYSAAWQSLLLRGFMDEHGFAPPSKVQCEQILAQLLRAKDDAKVEIRLADVVIRRFKQGGYFIALSSVNDSAEPLAPIEISIEQLTNDKLQLPSGESLTTKLVELTRGQGEERCSFEAQADSGRVLCRLPLASEKITIVYALPGSTRCQPHYRSKGRELKKLWQELQLPPWKRGRVPLLCYNGELVAAIGYWVEKRFLLDEGCIRKASAQVDLHTENSDTSLGLSFQLS